MTTILPLNNDFNKFTETSESYLQHKDHFNKEFIPAKHSQFINRVVKNEVRRPATNISRI